MKHQVLFSLKDKSKKLECCLLQFLFGGLRVNKNFQGNIFPTYYFRGNLVAHKTFHRYIVRAKRGTAQGSRDSTGNAPKSAGATLRRYNEAALTQVSSFHLSHYMTKQQSGMCKPIAKTLSRWVDTQGPKL